MKKILSKIDQLSIKEVDITGGSPETNPDLPYLIGELYKRSIKTTVRTNLCILEESEYAKFYEIYTQYDVNLVASLPCYLEF